MREEVDVVVMSGDIWRDFTIAAGPIDVRRSAESG
jgi:hypothetical protein